MSEITPARLQAIRARLEKYGRDDHFTHADIAAELASEVPGPGLLSAYEAAQREIADVRDSLGVNDED